MGKFKLLFVILLIINSSSFADPLKRHPEFKTPAKMRARVDFWIDIFSKYGKYHSVLHHRNFPQVVFEVLDMTAEAKQMGDVRFESYKKSRIKKAEAEIKTALNSLASGKVPNTPMETRISARMSFLPGGTAKYKEVLKDGLIRSQTGIKEKYADAISRSGRYLHLIEKIFVNDHGLPIELTRLPFVESSFDYKAYSSVGAAGIWQFMRGTGKLYMTVNNYVNERRDVVSASHAAAKYLKAAYKTLGTWPLALTSYNHGVAGVSKKVKSIGTKNIADIVEHQKTRVFGFASTNFYPEFLAALDIYDYKERFFPYTRQEKPLKIYSRKLTHPTSISYVINKTGISKDDIQRTNYGLSNSVLQGAYRIPQGYELKVPIAYANKLRSLKIPEPTLNSASSIYGGNIYTVRKGDTLSNIARKYKTSVSKIKSINGLSSDRVVIGQRLVVKERSKVEVKTAYKSTPEGTYTVKPGDSLNKIAAKYGIKTSKLKSNNKLKTDTIRVGQVLSLSNTSGTNKSTSAKSNTISKSYIVANGDSLWSISKKYGVSINSLKSLNKLKGTSLKIGQRLTIP